MKRLTIALSLLLATAAAADTPAPSPALTTDAFVGDWEGKGTYILRGDLYQCSLLKLVFSNTETTFTFASGQRVCDKHSETFDKVTLVYRDGGLFYADPSGKEIQVGTYSNNKMAAAFDMPDPSGGIRHWQMSMRAEGRNLMYEERRIMDNDASPLISFAGLALKK